MASAACCTPAPPAHHLAEGKTGKIGGLEAYLNKPKGASAAIIFAPDVFGYDAPLLKKLADKTAATGFYAVVPDYFQGDPYKPEDPSNPFANFGPWIAKHHPDASVDVTKTIIEELKSQGIKAIGISGFCWGARLAVQFAKQKGVIKAAVLLHPSLTTVDDIKEVQTPIAILGSEIDDFTPPSVIAEFKKVLDAKPIPSFVKVFDGQAHGWSIRYDVNIPHQVKGAEEAHDDMFAFYKKNL